VSPYPPDRPQRARPRVVVGEHRLHVPDPVVHRSGMRVAPRRWRDPRYSVSESFTDGKRRDSFPGPTCCWRWARSTGCEWLWNPFIIAAAGDVPAASAGPLHPAVRWPRRSYRTLGHEVEPPRYLEWLTW